MTKALEYFGGSEFASDTWIKKYALKNQQGVVVEDTPDEMHQRMAKEFAKVVAQVRIGRPLHEALDEMARKLQSSSIRRFIDALVMALLRGAPIVEVLHRHVAEARINQRNLVMDKAGKAETTMMIPIVFLILPISVLFALWPSINQLSFFAS